MLGTSTAPVASGGIGGGFLQGGSSGRRPLNGLLAWETSQTSGGATAWLWVQNTAEGSNDAQLCCDWTEWPSTRECPPPLHKEGTEETRRGHPDLPGGAALGVTLVCDALHLGHVVGSALGGTERSSQRWQSTQLTGGRTSYDHFLAAST